MDAGSVPLLVSCDRGAVLFARGSAGPAVHGRYKARLCRFRTGQRGFVPPAIPGWRCTDHDLDEPAREFRVVRDRRVDAPARCRSLEEAHFSTNACTAVWDIPCPAHRDQWVDRSSCSERADVECRNTDGAPGL